jgi:polysaccharide biosynthesis protein PslJ
VGVSIDHRPDLGSTSVVEPAGERTRGGPVTILRIYVVLLVLIPPTHIIEPLGAVGTPATVAALAALMLWGLGVVVPGDYLCRTAVPVRVVMGLLVGTIFLGYAVLHVRYVPGVEVLASDRALLQVLSWAGVVLLAAEGLRDRGEVYRVLRTLVAAVAVMAVVAFLQFRAGIDLAELANRIPGLHENSDLLSILDRGGFRRPAGTATHPIEFGCVIAMTLPLALHLARFDLGRSAVRRWLPVAAIAVGIPVAVSRSAVLAATVAALVLFAGLEPRLRPRALAAAAAFLVIIYATTPGLLGTFRNLFVHADDDPSITLRTSDYEVAEEYVRQSPWLGRGPGTFLSDTYIVLDNQYLMSVIEIGLVGLSVVIVYLLASAFLGRGVRHRTKDPSTRDLGQALAATSLASAVSAFTFDGFSFLMFAGCVPLCLGVAGAAWMMVRTAQRRIGVERPLEAGWWDPASDAQPVGVGVLDARAGGRLGEGATPSAVDAVALGGVALSDRGGDAGQVSVEGPGGVEALGNRGDGAGTAGVEHPGADEEIDHRGGRQVSVERPGADEELEWLTTSVVDPFGITGRSSSSQPGRDPTGDAVGNDTHDLRRVAALIGAGAAVMLSVGLPFVVGRDGDDPDVAAEIVTRPPPPALTSTTTSPTSDAGASQPAGATATRPMIIAMARPNTAAPIRPLRSDTDVAISSRPGSAPSSSPTPPPPAGTTGTTTPGTVPPTTTTPTTTTPTTTTPTTTTPTTPTTTTPTTTTPTTTTTTTTTPPPTDPPPAATPPPP